MKFFYETVLDEAFLSSLSTLQKTLRIKQYLGNHVVRILFTKKNGENREMYCTTNKDKLMFYWGKENEQKNLACQQDRVKKFKNPLLLSVWDVEEQDWRSFSVNSVKKVEIEHAE